MIEASVVTDIGSVRCRPGGPATGVICLAINGNNFPRQGWNDFVIVVLGWWAAALLQLFRNVSDREIVDFMDGPYAVEIAKTNSGLLQFRALDDSNQNKEVAVCEVTTLPFVLGLISQSHGVLDECRRQKWWSKDAETLKSSLEALALEFSKPPSSGPHP